MHLEIKFSEEKNNEINKLVEKFVDGMFDSVSYYTRMRNVNKDRAKLDMFVGKKAEFFTAEYLNKYHAMPLLLPDLNIYKGRQKSWAADLIHGEVNIHVKCCTASTLKYCGDYSWTFQYADKVGNGGKDDIFEQANGDLLSLVYIESPRLSSGIIKGMVYLRDIKHLLKDPKKSTLIGLKKCLYYNDLTVSEVTPC